MAKINMVYLRCTQMNELIRNGHYDFGAQLYRCKHCLTTCQLSYPYNDAKAETHQVHCCYGDERLRIP